MSGIKSAVLSICIALILVGFILKLAPAVKGRKSIKSILSLIIILIITAPLTKGVSVSLPQSSSTYTVTASDYSGLITETTVNLLKSRIENLLKEKGLQYTMVDIVVSSKNNAAEITSITVYVRDKESMPKVKKAILEELSLEVTVAIRE